MNVKPAGQRSETRRIAMVILAGFLMVGGILLSPLPIPVPIGLVTFLAGFAIFDRGNGFVAVIGIHISSSSFVESPYLWR